MSRITQADVVCAAIQQLSKRGGLADLEPKATAVGADLFDRLDANRDPGDETDESEASA